MEKVNPHGTLRSLRRSFTAPGALNGPASGCENEPRQHLIRGIRRIAYYGPLSGIFL
jgi:hypothetical protein